MRSEDPLRALAALPRPCISPFFPAQVAARAAGPWTPRGAGRLTRLYWLVLACVAGAVLAGDVGRRRRPPARRDGAAFPGPCLRALVAATSALAGRRSEGPTF